MSASERSSSSFVLLQSKGTLLKSYFFEGLQPSVRVHHLVFPV